MNDPLHFAIGALWGTAAAFALVSACFLAYIFKAQLTRVEHWLWLRFTPAGHRETARRLNQEAAFREWCKTPEARAVAQRMTEWSQSWGVSVYDLFPEADKEETQ